MTDRGCAAANYTPDKENPVEVADAIETLIGRLEQAPGEVQAETAVLARNFDLDAYGRAMSAVYQEIVNNGS